MLNIPEVTIKRLSLYYRMLLLLDQQGTKEISSKNLASLLSVNPSIVRKDFSYFGSFGKPKTGYSVHGLVSEIAKILGISGKRNVVIIGAGNLGSALAAYKGFTVFGFNICAIFDTDPHKIGKKIRGILCHDIKELEGFIKREKIEIAVIAVMPEAAQQTANLAAKSGVKALLNFAPVRLNVPANIRVSNVDLALELKTLSFFLKTTIDKKI